MSYHDDKWSYDITEDYLYIKEDDNEIYVFMDQITAIKFKGKNQQIIIYFSGDKSTVLDFLWRTKYDDCKVKILQARRGILNILEEGN